MTIPGACELEIQAGVIGHPSDVLVLDVGTPMKTIDGDKRLVAHSGRKCNGIQILFTGMWQGEKLHEVLFRENEADTASDHSLNSQVQVPPCARGTFATTSVPSSASTGTNSRSETPRLLKPARG